MTANDGSPRDELLRALESELAAFDRAGLRRRTDPGSPFDRTAEFVSNDYLGLATDSRVSEAMQVAVESLGAGAGAARLLGGGSYNHGVVEEELAKWLGAQAALFFPTGYQANVGVLAGLFDRRDAVVSDALNHASIVDGCRLARARVEVYRHADLADLERAIQAVRGARRVVVVTESVFGMDGDLAPLREIHELCAKHGALLLIDEAHAIGMLGRDGAGAWADVVSDGRALLGRIVTGGKALGVAGGFFVGDTATREVLLHRARSFVFSTAAPPAIANALLAAITSARASTRKREYVLGLARRFAATLDLPAPAAAIVPVVFGDPDAALAAASACRREGLDVRAVRPPTVPPGTARLRVSFHSHNTQACCDRLATVLRPLLADSRRAPVRIESRARGVIVCGTDTGVGKTVASALLVRAYSRRGAVRYWKPVQTGDESDTATVVSLAGVRADERLEPALWFALPASPHTAASAEGKSIDEQSVEVALEGHRRALGGDTRLVVELAGGLLVPYRLGFDQGDLLARTNLPVVLVARSGLGTLNHTGLTLEALARRNARVVALLLVGEPHPANAATLRALHPALPLFEVPLFSPLDAVALESWLDANPRLVGVLP